MNVILLSVVSFLNDVSSEMILPLLPVFILSLGGDEIVIGLVSGSMGFVSSTIKALFGFLSDRFGRRKPIVFSGYLSSALFKFLLSLSRVWQHVLVFTSLERIGKGIRTAPRDAMISESIPKEKGRGFGIHRAMDTSGALLGAILAFLLIYEFDLSIRDILLLAALISFLSLIPFIWIKETYQKVQMKRAFNEMGHIDKRLKTFLVIATVFSMSNISYMFFLKRSEEIFGPKFYLVTYIVFNIFYAIFSYPSGVLSDRIGRWKVLSAGYLLFAITSMGFSFVNIGWVLIPLFSLYGISFALFDGNQRAFVSDLSDPKIRATALGVFHTLIGVTSLPAGIIAGYLWKRFSYSFTFLYSGLLAMVSSILLIFYGLKAYRSN
ncbi:MAG TPA: MFS transporter [Thermoplasmatales archaeon]|nr:MFS transporter [Thermoplasmatales archaeon]HEX17266.1 MFS transporter [Thermoplasmatales archaeon]